MIYWIFILLILLLTPLGKLLFSALGGILLFLAVYFIITALLSALSFNARSRRSSAGRSRFGKPPKPKPKSKSWNFRDVEDAEFHE